MILVTFTKLFFSFVNVTFQYFKSVLNVFFYKMSSSIFWVYILSECAISINFNEKVQTSKRP
jgi:hypothetical protein